MAQKISIFGGAEPVTPSEETVRSNNEFSAISTASLDKVRGVLGSIDPETLQPKDQKEYNNIYNRLTQVTKETQEIEQAAIALKMKTDPSYQATVDQTRERVAIFEEEVPQYQQMEATPRKGKKINIFERLTGAPSKPLSIGDLFGPPRTTTKPQPQKPAPKPEPTPTNIPTVPTPEAETIPTIDVDRESTTPSKKEVTPSAQETIPNFPDDGTIPGPETVIPKNGEEDKDLPKIEPVKVPEKSKPKSGSKKILDDIDPNSIGKPKDEHQPNPKGNKIEENPKEATPTPEKQEKPTDTKVEEMKETEKIEKWNEEMAALRKQLEKIEEQPAGTIDTIVEESKTIISEIEALQGADKTSMSGDLGDAWWSAIKLKTDATKIQKKGVQNKPKLEEKAPEDVSINADTNTQTGIVGEISEGGTVIDTVTGAMVIQGDTVTVDGKQIKKTPDKEGSIPKDGGVPEPDGLFKEPKN